MNVLTLLSKKTLFLEYILFICLLQLFALRLFDNKICSYCNVVYFIAFTCISMTLTVIYRLYPCKGRCLINVYMFIHGAKHAPDAHRVNTHVCFTQRFSIPL